jgi:2-polyprenyl-3-methyl-5-hydroxy-6-metoxy-1,4-benzoquinol methylase
MKSGRRISVMSANGEEPDYNGLQTIATAYRQSALLFAAIELGVFAHADGAGCTAEDLARHLSMERVPLSLLLNGLVSLGVLQHDDGRYRLAPRFRVLAPGNDYFGDQLMLHKRQNANWLELSNILKGAHQAPSYESQLLQSELVPSYLDSIEKANRGHAEQTIVLLRPLFERAERVLDLGGGHGYYARCILTHATKPRVTVMDLERPIAYAQERLGHLLTTGRLDLVQGNALTHTTTAAYDVVMVNDLLHSFDAADQREILTRAVRALRNGGSIIVSKFRLSSDGTEPQHASLFSLKMYVNTLRGYLATDDETAGMLRDLDLTAVRVIHLDADRTIILGQRSSDGP